MTLVGASYEVLLHHFDAHAREFGCRRDGLMVFSCDCDGAAVARVIVCVGCRCVVATSHTRLPELCVHGQVLVETRSEGGL